MARHGKFLAVAFDPGGQDAAGGEFPADPGGRLGIRQAVGLEQQAGRRLVAQELGPEVDGVGGVSLAR